MQTPVSPEYTEYMSRFIDTDPRVSSDDRAWGDESRDSASILAAAICLLDTAALIDAPGASWSEVEFPGEWL